MSQRTPSKMLRGPRYTFATELHKIRQWKEFKHGLVKICWERISRIFMGLVIKFLKYGTQKHFSIDPNKPGLFKGSFFWRVGVNLTPLHILWRANPISILPYKIGNKLISSVLEERKYWYHLLHVDIICFFITRKCQKSKKNNENVWYWKRKASYALKYDLW